jgi:hypothetical protein
MAATWIQEGEYWIDPELRDGLPELDMIAFNELEQDILKNGLLNPIQYCVVEGKKLILDGHHRLKICTKQ